MKYLLDTNTCIRYLNGRAPRLRERFLAAAPQDIAVCTIVKAEMFYGAAKSLNPALSLAKQHDSQHWRVQPDRRAEAGRLGS